MFATLEFVIRRRVEYESAQSAAHLDAPENVHKLRQLIDFVLSLPFPVILWEAQAVLYDPLRQALRTNGNGDDPTHKALKDELSQLSERLKLVVA